MIRATDVQKSYLQGKRQIRALAGVSLEISAGKFAVIMGPSGSGKSTLLHLLGGLDRPTEGEILIDGRIISQMPDSELTLFRRRRIGFVFQFFNLLSTLTALENVMLPFILDGRPDGSSRPKARALLERVGLGGREDHLPEELSGGEIQRVAIARALIFDPPILLA
ncbi:MAG TPA: ABC transporter ATP-binding protein, partial [Candidatus Binatia bacterium]|nr:ABC transporter ATP-binding protein [Candidatus Binatia bacterium]